MALNMGSAVAFLELDTSKFKSGFKSAISDLKVFQASGATTEQKLKGLSSAFSTIGGGLTKGLTLPLVGVGAASVGVATKFESAMSQVAATMGITTEQIKNGNKDFENLQKTALNMGATTKYTASEAAEGLNILAQAGLSADESIKAIPTVLSLASAGAMSLDSAATYVTASVKGFGDSMDNAQKYADLMAKGATLANTDVKGLGEALSGVSATANNYNQSVDSTTLSLLRLAEQNITGGEASTMLARAMADIYTPTSNAKKALDELGISAYDGSGKARDFNDIVDDLSKAFSDMSDEEANATKNQIFTTYGMNAFNKMTAATTKTVDKFKTGLKDATGSAAQQAETQLDNLKGSLTLLQSALEGAGIVIGQRLAPYIRKLADFINALVTKFNNLTDEQQDMIVKIGLVVAAIGPVMLIISKLIGTILGIKKAISIIGTLIKTIGMIASPIGIAVVAIVGLVTAFVVLWNKSEEFRNFWLSLWDNIKSVVSNAVNVISKFFNVTLPNAINSMITFFNKIPYYLGYAIGLGIGYIAKFAIGIYKFATVQLPKYIAAIIKWFSQLPSKIWTWLTQAIQKVSQFASQLAQKAIQAGQKFLTNIIKFFTQLPSKVQNFLTKAVQNVTKWAASMKTKAIQAGRSFINGVVNGIKSLPGKIQRTLSNVINKLTSWVSKMRNKGVQGANQLKSGVVNTARLIPSQMVSIGANIVNGVWNGIQRMRSSFVSKVRSFFKGIVDGAKHALGIHSPSKVFDEQVGQNIVKGVIQGVNKQKKNAKKNAQQLAKLYISAGNKRLNELKKHNKYSLQLEINFWAKMLKQSKKGTAKYKKISAELSDAKKQRNKKMEELDKEYAKNVKEVQTKLNEDIQKVMSEYDSAVTSRAEQINSQLSLFKKFESKSENTKQGLIDNLQSQVSGLKDWENTLESLRKRGVATGLIEELQEAGVDSLADIKLLNSMTDTELNEYVSLWKEKQQLATKEAVREIDKTTYVNQIKELVNSAGKELDRLEQTYKNDLKKLGVGVKDTSKQIGQNIVDGLKKGMKSKYPDFLKYVQKEFDKITVTAKKTLKIKSPSRVFAEIGGFIAQGVGVGFKNEMPKVNEQLETELDKLSDVDTKQINVGVSFEVYKNEFSKITESILTSMQSFVIIMKNTFENMLDGLGSIKEDMADILEMLEQLNEMNNATFERISDKREKVDKTKEKGTDKADKGGDTFNFYNTKPDPYEYSRQMKKAKKELLYGI